jgi:asparagine synthase (glutamine-hydrolysing)
MCGICGIVHFDGRSPSIDLLSAMTESLRHRGPDAGGIHIEGSVGLGHRRLAIIDLSESGKQPMTNEDHSVWITYNGEIYNFVEVRKQLEERGHTFRSESDTEVILHAYETWGVDCLSRFNGMFAFALWDGRLQRLWLVRDRLGIKPLFYLLGRDRLLFASEIKGILCDPTVRREIDLQALHHYLSLNYTPAPYTLFCDIRQLPPAHYLLVDRDGPTKLEAYWDISYRRKQDRSETELVQEFEHRLSQAVSRQLVSDVPLGAFLSGGVDSSSIVYWMSRHMDQPVKTFSIGFYEKSFNELTYAREVAGLCKTDHHEYMVTPDAVGMLPRMVWHAEEPTADSSMLPVYYLSKLTRERVTVALSGDGADETLAGYETYSAYYLARLYRFIPRLIRQHILRPMVEGLPMSFSKMSWDFKLKIFVRGAELDYEAGHASWRTIFNEDTKRGMYNSEILDALGKIDTLDLYRSAFAQTDAVHPLDRMLHVDTRFYLPNDMLAKVDRMSMAHSLEVRVPFLDHQLVEFAASLPPNLKLRNFFNGKYALKKVLHQALPQIPVGRKKQGFNVPKGVWFTRELKDFILDHLSTEQINRMGLFKPEKVSELIDEHLAERKDNSHQIWGLLYLSLWWQQFMRKAVSTVQG